MEPFSEAVNERFLAWLKDAGGQRSGILRSEQMEWLRMIKDHVAASARVTAEDLELAPLRPARRPQVRAYRLFGRGLAPSA